MHLACLPLIWAYLTYSSCSSCKARISSRSGSLDADIFISLNWEHVAHTVKSSLPCKIYILCYYFDCQILDQKMYYYLWNITLTMKVVCLFVCFFYIDFLICEDIWCIQLSCSNCSRCGWHTHLTNHSYFDYRENLNTSNLSPMLGSNGTCFGISLVYLWNKQSHQCLKQLQLDDLIERKHKKSVFSQIPIEFIHLSLWLLNFKKSHHSSPFLMITPTCT